MSHYFFNPFFWEGQTQKTYFIKEHSAQKSAQLSVKAF